MRVSVLLENEDVNILKYKWLSICAWVDSDWNEQGISALIIKDIPRTITKDQFEQLCKVSGITTENDINWLSQMQFDEVGWITKNNSTVVTWKELVEQFVLVNNDFED